MTKLGNMNLPNRGTPMYYCDKCKQWVPSKEKHDKKRHIILKNKGGKK